MSAPIGDHWIQTYTGAIVHVDDPQPETIHLSDIAHALSLICRFNGHVSRFYPVASHSIHVAQLVPPEQALAALFHDASEAYICDIARPVKISGAFDAYRRIEAKIMEVIRAKFGLGDTETPEIKRADHIALATETKALVKDPQPGYWTEIAPDFTYEIKPTSPREAEMSFIRKYEELCVYQAQTSFF
jgi:5'-deoxynucleotidase YfbR-like HD superfamily hydrolase